MMKKRIIPVILGCLCGCLLVACGKSEQQLASEKLQKEFGMSAEEADVWADAFYGDDSEGSSGSEEQEEVEEESFKLVEASDAIKNSNIMDMIVQVYDAVIPIDGSVTVRDAFNMVNEGTEFEVHFKNHTEDSLYSFTDKIIVCDEQNMRVCAFRVSQGYEQTDKLFDCYVTDVVIDTAELYRVGGFVADYNENDLHALNCFYAGNICAGTYLDLLLLDDNVDNEAYVKRLAQYPRLNIDNICDYFDEQGLWYNTICTDMAYEFYRKTGICTLEGNRESFYLTRKLYFGIDSYSGTCTVFTAENNCYSKSVIIRNTPAFRCDMTDDQLEAVLNKAIETSNGVLTQNDRFLGWAECTPEGGSFLERGMVYEMSDGQFLFIVSDFTFDEKGELRPDDCVYPKNKKMKYGASIEELALGIFIERK